MAGLPFVNHSNSKEITHRLYFKDFIYFNVMSFAMTYRLIKQNDFLLPNVRQKMSTQSSIEWIDYYLYRKLT